MQIVIDIPEHQYNNIMAFSSVNLGRVPYKGIIAYAINAIKHGTPLPKGHGRLIDVNDIPIDCDYYDVDTAPTIIEADEEGNHE